MRTTLTIDDDLFGLLKEQARLRGVSFRVVVNDVLRAGLDVAARMPRRVPTVVPHSFGFRPGIDIDKLGQLVDEIEVEASASGYGTRIEG